jgi:hypothetical protein
MENSYWYFSFPFASLLTAQFPQEQHANFLEDDATYAAHEYLINVTPFALVT